MDERAVFERFHEALELQPRPGAYERFRIAFVTPPAAANKPRPVFRLRFSKMGLRVAAAVAVVAIAIALVAGFLAVHQHPPIGSVPAVDPNVRAYQTMMRTHDAMVAAVLHAGNCSATVSDPTCLPTLQRTIADIQQWIAEIDTFQTPAPFKVIDAQMRGHLAAAIPAMNTMSQAVTRGNQDLFTVSTNLAIMHMGWIGTAVGAINSWQSTSASAYIGLVTSERQDLASLCASCQDLAGVVSADQQVGAFQAAVVRNAAPSSLARKDQHLQLDLAQADQALIAMGTALLSNDQAAQASALSAFQRAMAAVNSDITAITG